MSYQLHIFWITLISGFFLGIVCCVWVVGIIQLINDYKFKNEHKPAIR